MSSGGEENSPRETKDREEETTKIFKQEPAEDIASYSECTSSYSTEEVTEPADSKDREEETADTASHSECSYSTEEATESAKTGTFLSSPNSQLSSSSSQPLATSTNVTIKMSNTLANIRSCVPEFDTEQTADIQNLCRRFKAWLENFEAVCEFEDVTVQKKKPALLAVGGSKLRELCTTLGVSADDGFAEVKALLEGHFKVKKNTTAERFKFLNTRPESAEETHDHWVTRLRRKVKDCEFDKMDDSEAIKLVLLLHTHNEKRDNSKRS
jgi:hypothetical protein